MARLESIQYIPHIPVIAGGTVKWVPDAAMRPIDGLPQLFWQDGTPWAEANHWVLSRVHNRSVKLNTIQSLLTHLHKYADWLEDESADWRHFPTKKSDRVLVRYRGALIQARDHGRLRPSTTTARMRAVIQFYRHCAIYNFLSKAAPKWQDKQVVVHYFDSVGFERTLLRLSTDVSIPNRTRQGIALEDGLLPITAEHQSQLLHFTAKHASEELNLMLMAAFFTGGRIGTLSTLRVASLETAAPDSRVPGMWCLPVGPGTGIVTKLDVNGKLLVPDQLMKLLKQYAYSPRRLKREAIATKEHKALLFLTRFGKPYKPAAVTREMVDLRRAASKDGLKFMQTFHFHQARATFGTWLMTIALSVTSVKAAIEFVRDALLHKHESTTMRYITFIEHTKAKIEVANAFSDAFLGLASRLGDPSHAG
jgi:integrase